MFVYKSKIANCFIATNPKVLTSSLDHQVNLKRYFSRRRYLHFFLNRLDLGPKYFVLARNPYSRIESFFREKLRQKVSLVFDSEQPYQLKRHQEIFYPYIGLKPSSSKEEKVNKLLALSFDDFIKILPMVFKNEDHLNLQTNNFKRQLLGIDVGLEFTNIVQIEDKAQLESLFDKLSLDLQLRINSSSEVKQNIVWNKGSIDIVNDIYHNDFKILGYQKW